MNRFVISALIQSEPVLQVIRRELRKLSPDSKINVSEIEAILPNVLKRDVTECDEASAAMKIVQRAQKKSMKKIVTKSEATPPQKKPDGVIVSTVQNEG